MTDAPRDAKEKLLTAVLDEWERLAGEPTRAASPKAELHDEIGRWKERVKLLLELARKAL